MIKLIELIETKVTPKKRATIVLGYTDPDGATEATFYIANQQYDAEVNNYYDNIAVTIRTNEVSKFERILKDYSIKYKEDEEAYNDLFVFHIPLKNNRIEVIDDSLDETKVTPKTGKIPIKKFNSPFPNRYFIPYNWQGNYEFEDIIFEKDEEGEDYFLFYFLGNDEDGNDGYEAFKALTTKLDQLKIPYRDTVYGDGDAEVRVYSKYFSILNR